MWMEKGSPNSSRQANSSSSNSRRGRSRGSISCTMGFERWTRSFSSVAMTTVILFGISIFLTIQGCDGQLRLGKAVNLFIRYGYLSISMKVISHNDSETWLFKEPTKNIFKDVESLETTQFEEKNGMFNGDFHMEFCDNKRQLFQAYFRDFTIDRLDRPWKAFTGGWHPDVAAKKLGINSSFIHGDYCYVLVRVSRFRESSLFTRPIPANQILEDNIRLEIDNITLGDNTAAVEFMNKYGTHYINNYVTGNSLYQVFVFNRRNYMDLKEKLKSKGIASLSQAHLYNYFAPWYAEHLGKIRCASGNTTVEKWASKKLRMAYYLFTYPSLLKLHGNGTLLRHVDEYLGNEAILQLDLKSIGVVFKDPEKRQWFQEIQDNYLKLWEVNM